MGSDCYKVEVLHYLNPYLIWVEVTDRNVAKPAEFSFEQIGVYGVLPLQMSIDIEASKVDSASSDTWMPAAAACIEKALNGAKEVFFCPTYISRRSSIFDDNTHKFGEILITQPNGKQKKLSKLLIKSGLAEYDECQFHEKVRLGKLKTKLNNTTTKAIVTQLENYYTKNDGHKKKWEKSVRKQTTIFHTAQQIESALTVENLEALNRLQNEDHKSVDVLLKRKLKDLEMCKDVTDEESLGRGSQKGKSILEKGQKHDINQSLVEEFPKGKGMKLKDLETCNDSERESLERTGVHKGEAEVEATMPYPKPAKEFSKVNNEYNKNMLEKTSKNNVNLNQNPDKYSFMKVLLQKHANYNKKAVNMPNTTGKFYLDCNPEAPNNTKTKTTKIEDQEEIVDVPKALLNSAAVIKEEHILSSTIKETVKPNDAEMTSPQIYKHINDWVPQREHYKLAPKPQKTRNTIPEYDKTKEKLIAFGPPELNKAKLKQKIVPLRYEGLSTGPEVLEEVIPKKEDFFGDVDSDVEIEIPKKEKAEVQVKARESKELQPQEVVKKLLHYNTNVQKVAAHAEETYTSLEKSNKQEEKSPSSLILKRKLLHYQHSKARSNESTLSSVSDTSNKDTSTSTEDIKHKKAAKKQTDLDSDDESISEVIEHIDLEYPTTISSPKNEESATIYIQAKNHVNPFQNVDPNISGFVEKLVAPVMMVHTKKNKRIQPTFDCRDINFNTHIQIVLKNMGIEKPMMLQTVSWLTILRGYSLFMISPKGSGKTMGYLPPVCRLVADSAEELKGLGPICIIVCATTISVSIVEKLSRTFLGSKNKVLACYAGMNELDLTTALLNGCDLLISTPSILVRLMKSTDFSVDLRRLTTFVLDDCERVSEVYSKEIQFFLLNIKEMLKRRASKELKVQYVLASRIWCDFMEPLAKKAPDTVISIGAFQECVLYAKANTTTSFVTKENKLNNVIEFLKQIDNSKKTVIVCREDKEVEMLEDALKKSGYIVYACNNTMTVQDLYKLSAAWNDYQEPVSGPILVCCDGNLTHMNVTDAHYLFHYSLPPLFSMFCKRFAVLNENYPSIFKTTNETVKIKILLENNNFEQLPKILHFIKRSTSDVPKFLDEASEKVLAEKDASKARNMVPLCDSLLSLGKCPDLWNCQERHAVFKECDEPKEWVPKSGFITFRILHYHNAVLYSARLLSNDINGEITNFPQTYNLLSMKIAKYFGNESNKKLHGVPAVGDVCAVSIKQHFFVRCQVVKILSHYQKGNPNHVLIRLIDEERLERSRDICLYYLPEEMKTPETYVVQVRLANIQPKYKDITYSELAKCQLEKITEKNDDMYLTGEIALTMGNCIFVNNIQTCLTLSSMNNTVFRNDFRQELSAHSTTNPKHIPELRKLCEDGGITIKQEMEVEIPKPIKELPVGRWAHLEEGKLAAVYTASVENPDTFFVRLDKFNDCINLLVKDIKKYVSQNPESLTDIRKGDIILAEFPDDKMYERARIDEIINKDKVKCFFVDLGDWREVSTKNLAPITDKFINQLPFQAIECRMIGVKPHGEQWTEFSKTWFNNSLEDDDGYFKLLYVKYFTKEQALYTKGHKYGVALVDTNSEKDIILNKLMIEANLAKEVEEEIGYLSNIDFIKIAKSESQSSDNEEEWEKISSGTPNESLKVDSSNSPKLDNIFQKQPIRSVPLVDSDYDSDEMDINITDDFMGLFKPVVNKFNANLRAIESVNPEKVPFPSQKLNLLDSDDLTSPDTSQLSETNNTTQKHELLIEVEQFRKPKLCWRQNTTNVFIKIMLIGVENYDLKIGEKHLSFNGTVNDTNYGFDFELYGVVDGKTSIHANKGQYILVNLKKILKIKWLMLTKDYNAKWIVYDVDHIDESSDEDNFHYDTSKEAIRNMHKSDTESDDDFVDDIDDRYKR